MTETGNDISIYALPVSVFSSANCFVGDVAMDTVTYSFHVFYQVNWGYLSIILDKISTVQPQLRANMYSFIVDTAEESLKERKKNTPKYPVYFKVQIRRAVMIVTETHDEQFCPCLSIEVTVTSHNFLSLLFPQSYFFFCQWLYSIMYIHSIRFDDNRNNEVSLL